jgi:hypothetical protein
VVEPWVQASTVDAPVRARPDSRRSPALRTSPLPVLVLCCAGGPSKRQAAHVKFHAPAPGDSSKIFRGNGARIRIRSSSARGRFYYFRRGMEWEGATACAVVRVTCWGFYGGNNSLDSSHQIKPIRETISIA